MRPFRLDRRALLRGLMGGGLVTIGLPPLEIFLDRTPSAHADDGFPRRFGLFFWGNGNLPELWVPSTRGPDWIVSEQLSPLEGIKDKVTVVSGTNVALTNRQPHGTGSGAVLSGAPLQIRGRDWTFTEPSIDQLVARSVGKDTRFKSLELGVVGGSGLSFNGPNSQNPPELLPGRLFDRLFNPEKGFRAPGSDAPVDPKLRLRRSVLDAVMGDAQRLHEKLGRVDRERLDQHLTGLRELETRIARLEEDPPMLLACAQPVAPTATFADVQGRPPLTEISAAMVDLLAMALACDQTRVFSFFFGEPVGDTLYPGAPAGHHQLTHDEPGDQPVVNGIVKFIMAEFAKLLQRLDSIPEGEGTLLDHTVILATSDVSFGRTHSIEDYPILIGGSAGGAIRTGEHLATAGDNVSRVGFSLLQAMGVPVSEFGKEEGAVSSGLAGLLV
ncbi:MAG: DUF1552 domain-containing protein [Deltaproteobacteria bacterium]|nr:DUF1552 domain-containing protein [Deltaproteobacteria bacterium]